MFEPSKRVYPCYLRSGDQPRHRLVQGEDIPPVDLELLERHLQPRKLRHLAGELRGGEPAALELAAQPAAAPLVHHRLELLCREPQLQPEVMEHRRVVEKSHDIAEIKHEYWNSHDLYTPHGGRNPTIHYRFFVSCSQPFLSTFLAGFPGPIAAAEKHGAKSPAFKITWARIDLGRSDLGSARRRLSRSKAPRASRNCPALMW